VSFREACENNLSVRVGLRPCVNVHSTGTSQCTNQYDDEGNRTKRTKTSTGEVTEYEWDLRNRLTKVTEKDASGNVTKVCAGSA